MYCNKCGKEIESDSSFCNYCGAKQEKEKKDNSEERSEETTGCAKAIWGILAIFFVIAFIIIIVTIGNRNGNGCSEELTTQENQTQSSKERKATRSDLVLKFERVKRIKAGDIYYVEIQAQEKIVDLELRFYYKNVDGKVLLTRDIYVGKVVPGNRYTFELNQSGMAFSDLDKTTKFGCEVISGTVEE